MRIDYGIDGSATLERKDEAFSDRKHTCLGPRTVAYLRDLCANQERKNH